MCIVFVLTRLRKLPQLCIKSWCCKNVSTTTNDVVKTRCSFTNSPSQFKQEYALLVIHRLHKVTIIMARSGVYTFWAVLKMAPHMRMKQTQPGNALYSRRPWWQSGSCFISTVLFGCVCRCVARCLVFFRPHNMRVSVRHRKLVVGNTRNVDSW